MNIEITFRAETQDELEGKLASLLVKCGWVVQRGGKWERCKEVGIRYGVTDPAKLSMQLKRFRGQFLKEVGPTGRILRMQVTPELDEYLERLNGR